MAASWGGRHDVVVFLDSDWDSLRSLGTRWRAIVRCWVDDPRVGRLTLVDYPTITRRPGRLARGAPSWLPGTTLVQSTIPGGEGPGRLDSLIWRSVARALRRALPRSDGRLVVAANPLWIPVLEHIPAARRAVDAGDDLRHLTAVEHLHARIDVGYRKAGRADAVTAVTDLLAGRLARDYGVDAVVAGNGVNLDAYQGPIPHTLDLPSEPFAVYVSVIEDRVDLDLLSALVRSVPEIPVVVAGPALGSHADRLRRTGVRWLGPVHVDVVPELVRRASVGIVPHTLNRLTEVMEPLKVLEYLAAGLPIVSTPLPPVAALSSRVEIADSADAFCDAVRRAVRRGRFDDPDPVLEGRDWRVVADTMLTTYLGGPTAPDPDERRGRRALGTT